MNSKIKLFGGFAVAGTLLAGALGSAAGLDVSGGVVQAGSVADVTCDDSGIQVVGYGVDLDTQKGHVLHLTEIDPTCEGYFVGARIEVDGGAAIKLEKQITAADTGTNIMKIGIPGGVPLEDIVGLYIVIG